MQSPRAVPTRLCGLPPSGIPSALWTKRPCRNCWLSLLIAIYWSQLWGEAGCGSRKLGTSLLKESFCDRAKHNGVIFDSSNSFIPHIQAVSKSRKRCFEMYQSLFLKTSTATTLVHVTIIPHGVHYNCSLTPLLVSALVLPP